MSARGEQTSKYYCASTEMGGARGGKHTLHGVLAATSLIDSATANGFQPAGHSSARVIAVGLSLQSVGVK